MIIKRTTMLGLGFKTLGLDFGGNDSVYRYIKYYDKERCILIADAFSRSLYAFKFDSKKELDRFREGKFSVSYDQNDSNRIGIYGQKVIYKPKININTLLNICFIERTKHLTDGIKLFEKKYIANEIQEKK